MKKLKILNLNYTDYEGSGNYALRVHQAFLKCGYNSELYVCRKKTTNKKVFTFNDIFFKIGLFFRPKIANLIKIFFFSEVDTSTSAILDSRWVKFINNSEYSLVNIFWINSEMLSIKDLSRINKPFTWTMLDMWPFTGGENITLSKRFKNYNKLPKPKNEYGIDFNKWLANRKIKYLKNNQNFELVSPSRSLKKLALQSFIFKDKSINIINPPIETKIFLKINKFKARKLLNLPKKEFILFYSYFYGKHKGIDILTKILKSLKKLNKKFVLVLLGKYEPDFLDVLEKQNIEFKLFKKTSDLKLINNLYSACDLTLALSKIEPFGQVALESNASGTPVLAFSNTGFAETIKHMHTGFLVEPYSVKKSVNYIVKFMKLKKLQKKMSFHSRQNAIKNFSQIKTVNKYINIYKKSFNMKIN